MPTTTREQGEAPSKCRNLSSKHIWTNIMHCLSFPKHINLIIIMVRIKIYHFNTTDSIEI